MITFNDIKVSDYEIGLSLLVGKKIKEVKGSLTRVMGKVSFELTEIVFEDSSKMSVEGEHDFPYLTEYQSQPQPNFDDDTLARLYEEQDEE